MTLEPVLPPSPPSLSLARPTPGPAAAAATTAPPATTPGMVSVADTTSLGNRPSPWADGGGQCSDSPAGHVGARHPPLPSLPAASPGFPELSSPIHPSYPYPYHHPLHPLHPQHHGLFVDAAITDGNGNASRYSPDNNQINVLVSTIPLEASSLSSSGGLAARVNDPHRLSGAGGAGGGESPENPSAADLFFTANGADRSGRYNSPTLFHNNLNVDVNAVSGGGGMTTTGGGLYRRSSPCTPGQRSSSRSSAHTPSPNPSSTATNTTSHTSSSSSSAIINSRPSRLSSTSSDNSMSQDSPHLPAGGNNTTTTATTSTNSAFTLNPDLTLLQTHPNYNHHMRASSFRESKQGVLRHEPDGQEGGGDIAGGAGGGGDGGGGIMGQARRNSMPNVNNLLNVPGVASARNGSATDSPKEVNRIRRVRSFKTTSKGGIVNRGDSFKKKSTHSLMSTGSTVTDSDARARCNSGNNNSLTGGGGGTEFAPQGGVPGLPGMCAPAYFRVNVIGAAGVGKTSMAHQFLTSETVDHDDADETHQMTVTVLLDGEESTIEFIDSPNRNEMSEHGDQPSDAYVVVYAINDHQSFVRAEQLIRYLRVDYGTDRAILLVANKIDLVRKRKVTADEARLVATTFDCKYAETSAALNHHVDELLVGIVTQIRLQLSIPFTTIFFPHKDAKRRKDKASLCKGPKGFFARLFKRSSSQGGGKKDRGVDNLLY